MKNRIFLLLAVFACIHLSAQEREVISAAGDDVSIDETSMSFTIGEPVVELSTSDSIYLTAGFQQSNIIVSIPMPIEDIKISIKVFPNPAVNHFYLDIDNRYLDGLFLVMHNTKGEFIRREALKASPQKVSLEGFSTGVYYLTVLNQSNEKLHQFKILKTE